MSALVSPGVNGADTGLIPGWRRAGTGAADNRIVSHHTDDPKGNVMIRTRWTSLTLLAGLLAGGVAAPTAAAVPGPEGARFVTPGTASAGEWIPVLAYRHRDRGGPLELRFDEQPVTYRLIRYAAFRTPGVTELFLTFPVPGTAARGEHEIQLYEPAAVPGAPPERLAVSEITLGP
jgi:hypothetical protein